MLNSCLSCVQRRRLGPVRPQTRRRQELRHAAACVRAAAPSADSRIACARLALVLHSTCMGASSSNSLIPLPNFLGVLVLCLRVLLSCLAVASQPRPLNFGTFALFILRVCPFLMS